MVVRAVGACLRVSPDGDGMSPMFLDDLSDVAAIVLERDGTISNLPEAPRSLPS